MDADPRGEQEGERGVGRNEGNSDADDAKEENTAGSFSSEKKTREP